MIIKPKLLLTSEDWLWSIAAYRAPTGTYYVTLANGEGHSVHASAIIGGFESMDWLLLNGAALYLQLVEKLNYNLHMNGKTEGLKN